MTNSNEFKLGQCTMTEPPTLRHLEHIYLAYKSSEKVSRALLTCLFELIMPTIFSNVLEREPMFSSKGFSDASFVCGHTYHVGDNIVGSSNGNGHLVHWGEDELSSFAGMPSVSINCGTFLTCFSCKLSIAFSFCLVFCNPHPCVIVLQIVSLGFLMSSSHLFPGLPTALLRSGFHFAAF